MNNIDLTGGEILKLVLPLREEIDQFLAQYSGQTVLYLPNPGNAGDSLIATGAFQAFARRDVNIQIIDLNSSVIDRVVFLGGGGNFVPLYSDIRTAFEKFIGRANKIILLPHTIQGNEDIIKAFNSSCTIFCRDSMSYDHVRRHNSTVEAVLAHDMAFHVDVPGLLNDSLLANRGQKLLEEGLARSNLSLDILETWPSIDYLRLGIESTLDQPETDIDISVTFRLGTSPEIAPLASWCFLKAISIPRHINTDRLHVAIGAALVNTPCTLRDNSYGKNAAVYRNSLQAFRNLRFVSRYN